MKEKLNYITNLVKDLGNVRLGKACGKYHELIDNDTDIIAISFAGKYGYEQTNIKDLDARTVNTIYDDLYKDFGEQD